MKISFVITGTIDLDDAWGDPVQLQREVQHDFVDALRERSGQWSGLETRTEIAASCTTMLQGVLEVGRP